MIQIAICDDEPHMLEELSKNLSAYMTKQQKKDYRITCFSDGQSLLDSNEQFDLFFLDIQMQHLDGMETAKKLRALGKQGLFIFVTVLKESVFDAFEVQAYDYLIKPLEPKRFYRTMERAMQSLDQQTEKTLLIQKGTSCQLVSLSQILYGEVLGRKISLHLTDEGILSYNGRLEELEQQVDKRFYRCHRSYLVNLDYVRGCKDRQVLLIKGDPIPVSRLREKELIQSLLRHMKERKNTYGLV